uniref:Uncharacterized protein n=1 Tax=Anopheles culicifacies TaxID=139723 RepID=A0A182MC64_9DIPT
MSDSFIVTFVISRFVLEGLVKVDTLCDTAPWLYGRRDNGKIGYVLVQGKDFLSSQPFPAPSNEKVDSNHYGKLSKHKIPQQSWHDNGQLDEFLHGTIKHIDMSRTFIHNVDDETFQGLRLESLKLVDNKIQDISEKSFKFWRPQKDPFLIPPPLPVPGSHESYNGLYFVAEPATLCKTAPGSGYGTAYTPRTSYTRNTNTSGLVNGVLLPFALRAAWPHIIAERQTARCFGLAVRTPFCAQGVPEKSK